MLVIWVLLALLAISLIYIGSKFVDLKQKQLGLLMILIGCFQLLAQLIALI